MISLPKLDDQNYAEIVEAAKRRIPVIFPEWTDFNEHDPGITLYERFFLPWSPSRHIPESVHRSAVFVPQYPVAPVHGIL